MTQLYSLVCQLAADLQKEGKTPSLALIRARAGKNVDAPALFSAYQSWRASPPAPETTEANNQHNMLQSNQALIPANAGADIAALQHSVLRLEQKLDRVLVLLQQLQQRGDY